LLTIISDGKLDQSESTGLIRTLAKESEKIKGKDI